MPDPSIPWEDVSSSPSWVSSIGSKRPWNEQSPPSTVQIPFTEWAPEQLFQADMFHTIKLGISRHFAGSTVVVFSRWGYFHCENRNMADVLSAAYVDFKAACKQMRSCPNLKNFTREILHWPKSKTWPWGGWKGSDSLLICRWLLILIREGPLVDGHRSGSLLRNTPDASHRPLLHLGM